jgi:hypothetical protein
MVSSQPWANSSRDPISKKPITKKGWWSDSSGKRICKPQCRPPPKTLYFKNHQMI